MAEPSRTEGGPGDAPLACAVLSLRGERGLAAAVRSLLTQDPRPDVVVVNSGGGSARETLSRAGLDVPLIDVDRRLLPGAVRNLGIAAARAPIVAFLAGDCLARPGWVARRLDAHRAGAAAVASALVPAEPATPSARASHLLLHHRRRPDTPPARRQLYSLSFDRSVLRRHGPFREDVAIGEDTEYLERLGPDEAVVWGDGVLTAHRYPPTVAELVLDQFRRGRGRAIAEPALGGRRSPSELARRAVRNVAPALRAAGGTASAGPASPARTLLADAPLVTVGAISCAAGALSVAIGTRR